MRPSDLNDQPVHSDSRIRALAGPLLLFKREVLMRKWLRRIRGAIGIGLTWGWAWFGAGLILLLVAGVGAADIPFPPFFGLLGFLAGVTFSGVLTIYSFEGCGAG